MRVHSLLLAVICSVLGCGNGGELSDTDAGRISPNSGCDFSAQPGNDLVDAVYEYDYACVGEIPPTGALVDEPPPAEDCSAGIWPDLDPLSQVCPTYTEVEGGELPPDDPRSLPVEIPVSESGSFLGTPPTTYSNTIKVVAWNMQYTSHLDDQIETLVSHPLLADADVWLLSEVDRCSLRNGMRRAAREMAQRIGGDYVYGIEFVELGEGVQGDTGQAIISRRPITGAGLTCHSSEEDWFASENEPRLGSRIALHADIPVGESYARVHAVHFESNDIFGDKRVKQVREMLDQSQARACDRPQIVAGDFNTWYCTAPELEVLRRSGFSDALMTLGDVEETSKNGLRLDYVWTRGFRVVDGGVVRNLDQSDHHALWAVLELGP